MRRTEGDIFDHEQVSNRIGDEIDWRPELRIGADAIVEADVVRPARNCRDLTAGRDQLPD